MDLSPYTILVPLFLVVVVFLIQRSKNINLPPGPPKLPFIGHLHLLSGSEPPHRTLASLAKKYGALMHLQLGQIPTLIVSSPETAKLFLKTHDINFASRPSLLATEILSNGNKGIGFSPYGDYWRQARKICTAELLSMKRVDSFRPIREKEFTNLCRWIASQSGSVINLTEKVLATNYDIITVATLGKKTDLQAKFLPVIKEIFAAVSTFCVDDFFPSLKLFGKMSGFRKKIEGLHRESEKIMLEIIDEHKLLQNNDSADQRVEDLLDILLKLQDAGLDLPLATKHIIAILLDMFAAGVETSATTLEWAISELLKNPSVLKKAQDEVRKVFDTKTGVVDESYFHELKYLKLVIKETLRMHQPGPLLLPRECREQCTINGYVIPTKTRVFVNAWAISMDHEHWKDPENFEPERFLNNNFDYNGNDFHYLPFGAGRRICPGTSFGLASVELPLAMFLYHFDWVLPGEMKPEEMDMTEYFGATSKRKSELKVILVGRRALPLVE